MLVLLGISFLTTQSTRKNLITQSATKGEIKTLSLPDGSQLILNANSSVTYSTDFIDNRKLILKGEAYFKVVKNPSSPFIVKTEQFETKVLGTSFTIKAYKNHPNQISVLTGKVEVNSTKKNPLEFNSYQKPTTSLFKINTSCSFKRYERRFFGLDQK